MTSPPGTPEMTISHFAAMTASPGERSTSSLSAAPDGITARAEKIHKQIKNAKIFLRIIPPRKFNSVINTARQKKI
jgi:hypothetical protein